MIFLRLPEALQEGLALKPGTQLLQMTQGTVVTMINTLPLAVLAATTLILSLHSKSDFVF